MLPEGSAQCQHMLPNHCQCPNAALANGIYCARCIQLPKTKDLEKTQTN